MLGQAEAAQLLVVEVGEGQLGDVGLGTHMFHVAVLAALDAWQLAVQAAGARPLAGDLHMAVLALGIRQAVQRGVAVPAFFVNVRM